MYKVGVIGLGKMGGALVRAILDKNLISPENILIFEKIKEKAYPFEKRGVRFLPPDQMSRKLDILIIAVEPKNVKEVLESFRGKLNSSQIVISIAAGITTSFISRILGNSIPVLRVMPNSAILAGEGMCVISTPGREVDKEKISFVKKIFKSVGDIVELPEESLDAVTGLSGSGPAYVYLMIQGLIKGGKMAGLTEDVSRRLATQTVLGAAKLLKESKREINDLISSVATPGGTTVEGLKVLREGSFVDLIARAVMKATQRARQIRKEIN